MATPLISCDNSKRVIILGQAGGWHERSLTNGLLKHGFDVLCLPITRIISHIQGIKDRADFCVSLNDGDAEILKSDIVIVRAIPGGSLEQVIYRMDALHALEEWGCKVINSAETIERSVDKFHASFLISKAGIDTPHTYAAERFEDAMKYFAQLGGDIVLKPLFGSEGKGVIRINDIDIAYRTFRALEITRSVFYLQEYLPSLGWDLRVFVLGGKIMGCIKRSAHGSWKNNVTCGASAENYPVTDEIADLSLRTAVTFNADYCGVDLYPSCGGFKVIEINGIPGWKGFERATGVRIGEEIAKWINMKILNKY